jgi:hypothetical protein
MYEIKMGKRITERKKRGMVKIRTFLLADFQWDFPPEVIC